MAFFQRLILLICVVALVGCVTRGALRSASGDSAAQPVSNFDGGHDQTIEAAELAAEDEDEDLVEIDVLAPEALEEGFCKDDIFATYLMQQYFVDHPAAAKAVRGSVGRSRAARRQAKSVRDRNEVEALFYARSRLVGPMVPYFGAIPVVSNAKVEQWLRYFKTTGQETYLKWMVRGESFREVVQPLLKQEGLPQELFFLAMVESGFNNTAYSRARATGPWQFMKGTAQLYGLKVTHWVDERRDPVKSTIAAARYLRDLYAEFGDWYLAMAAYNAGPGKIRSAIRRSGTRDFWKIAETRYIRAETKHYVPKVLSALILASTSDAQAYRVAANPADKTPTHLVTVKRPVKIDEIAQTIGLPSTALSRWNPELVRGITPPNAGQDGYALRLPEKFAAMFAEIEPRLSELKITDVVMHTVRRGDTLSRIAHRYRVKIQHIISMNPRLSPRALRVGKEIAVPIPGVVETSKRSAGRSKNQQTL